MNSVESLNEAAFAEQAHSHRPLRRYIAVWDFAASNVDEMSLTRGDILLVADEFNDGWMRGLRLGDLEIGFFPAAFVAEDKSPIYKLQELKLSTEYYDSDQKLIEYDSSRRSRIALEICTSEGAYCSKLKMLNEKFIIALCQNTGVISHEDYNAIFSNIQPLLSLSESLLVQLKSRMAAWGDRYTRIGDIFTHMGHHMKLFVTYAVQHTLGSQMLIKISAQEKFRNWLERAELDCQRTLNSLLLEPIQRVPRYELLLKDLLKHTSEEHPDHQTLKEALNFVQKIATDCNENIRKAENELKLLAITKRFPNDDVDIVPARFIKSGKDGGLSGSINLGRRKKRLSGDSTSSLRHSTSSNSLMTVRSFFESEQYRVFVKEGSVMKTRPDFTDPSERYLFLCSDLLLIAQPTSRNRKTFKLKERVLLAHAWITDAGSLTGQIRLPERGFILGTPKKLYHFMAPSPEEKNNWFQELQSKIFAQKRLFNDLLSHLSIPDEQFQCVKMKARVSYLGMLQDELSFKSGDEICVVGFKQGTSKWKPGLYSNEPFDPSPEWYYGTLKGSSGWFPMQCVLPIEGKSLESFEDELKPTPMYVVLALKQRMAELTGRMVTPLRESERTVKVLMGEGNFKTLRIAPGSTVQDVVRMYFKVKPDSCLTWTLVEQSTDETVNRPIIDGEDPCEVVDFWGKSKDNMRFFLQQSLISEAIVASGSEDVSLYS